MKSTKPNKRRLKKHLRQFAISVCASIVLLACCFALSAHAAPSVTFELSSGEANGSMGPLEMLFLLTILALAPSILVMMTSFTRIVIVLSLLRSAMGTQQTPPNQIIIGLSLFLTLFIMTPTLRQINERAIIPYRAGEIVQEQALQQAAKPIKEFMIRQTQAKDLNLFLSIADSGRQVPRIDRSDMDSLTALGLEIIVPSFITSELKRAFTIGFLLFIPFLIIDLVVSSTLMSMGMVMLPPSMIALPFKLMLFVLVDGWELLLGALARGFH
jgi:flagellar biosynthetic protein FliP